MVKKYTVELNNHKGKVDVNQIPLKGRDARVLAEEHRKKLPTGSSAWYSVREDRGAKAQKGVKN
jgi:hypothetical protein